MTGKVFLCGAAWLSLSGLASVASVPELKGSEILSVLQGADSIPTTLERFREWAELHGTVTDTLVPFSDSPLHTDLEEPRIVVSSSPKFFYGAIPRLNGRVDFEFLSWNSFHGAFDFGLIADFGTPQARMLLADLTTCLSCHRTLGPIVSDRPWTNFTGANSPIGTYLSLGILTKRVEQDPQRYGRFATWLQARPQLLFDPAFGNLTPEPAIALGPLRYHGTPLFQLRGSFDLDANTRQGHYLMHSHQILKALGPEDAIAFARGLVEQALLGLVYPEEIEFLFSWDQYLEEWVEKVPSLKSLPGSQSPVLKNFQPLFDNPALVEQAGILPGEVHTDPVGSLVKLSDYVRRRGISGYPPEELPSSGKAFVEFKPNHNGGAETALWLLCDFTRKDAKRLRASLDKKGISLKRFFQRGAWKSLWATAHFPTHKEIWATMSPLIGIVPGEVPLNTASVFSATKLQVLPAPVSFPQDKRRGHRCLTCHGGAPEGSAKTFPFDPLERIEWEQRLGDPNLAEATRRWARQIRHRIKNKSMPLAISPEAEGFHPLSAAWQDLMDYLSRL